MTNTSHSKRSPSKLPVKRLGPVTAVLVAVVLVPVALGGCSSMVDHVPHSMGGLPEGTPARPTTPSQYPAVHDMPPPRQDNALSEADSKRLREELKNSRKRGTLPEPAGTASPNAGGARNP
jgi:hypothetical protein